MAAAQMNRDTIRIKIRSNGDLSGMRQTPAQVQNSPANLIGLFGRSIKLIVATAVLGALLGLALSFVLQPRWTARMTVQIGQVSSPGMPVQRIENQDTAVDRYNLAATRLLVLKSLNMQDKEDTDPTAKLIFNTLKATAAKGPDLLELSVTGPSREQALNALVASFNVFAVEHQQKFQPAVEQLKHDLTDTTTRLTEAQHDAERTYDSLRGDTSSASAGAVNSRDILLGNTVTLINSQVQILRNQVIQLQEALGPLRTYPSRIVETAYVPLRPSTPSRLLLIAAGIALGLLAGAAIAALRQMRLAA
jgi:capsular polysaccharide biosynthesis protein